VRVTESRRRADEWAVVLAAAGIPHWLRHRLDGWALMVTAGDAPAAFESLAAYERENAAGDAPAATARPWSISGLVVALLLIGLFAVTGPRAGGSAWFTQGSADAARILAGEWWRTVTALTLHADAPHLLGNAVAWAVLATAVIHQVGPGVGLALLLVAGAAGNALTAAAHGPDHSAVGASTAIFAAVGLLAVLRVLTPTRAGTRARWWMVLAASFLLLVLLGTSPNADILAHLFGLMTGATLGPLAAAAARRPVPGIAQVALIIATAATIAAAWRLAL
jgi:membrane associated rhomboid family serine protease